MTHRTASTTTVGSLSSGKSLDRLVEVPAFESRRVPPGPPGSPIARRPPLRASAGSAAVAPAVTTRDLRKRRGLLDLATRPIDPAGLVEARSRRSGLPISTTESFARTQPGWSAATVIGMRALDHHHATHVLRQSPGEQLHVQPAEGVPEQQVRRRSLDRGQQVAQRADDERAGLRFGQPGARPMPGRLYATTMP